MPVPKRTYRNPWAWVSTLYLAEGLPYVVVMTVAVIVYKGLGISNTDITLYTGWLYLPWVIKPFWSPVVDILKTKRAWIWVMQLILGAGLAGDCPDPPREPEGVSIFAGFFLAARLQFRHAGHRHRRLLSPRHHAKGAVVLRGHSRTTFYRIAMICGQGLAGHPLAGVIQNHTGLPKGGAACFGEARRAR